MEKWRNMCCSAGSSNFGKITQLPPWYGVPSLRFKMVIYGHGKSPVGIGTSCTDAILRYIVFVYAYDIIYTATYSNQLKIYRICQNHANSTNTIVTITKNYPKSGLLYHWYMFEFHVDIYYIYLYLISISICISIYLYIYI